MAYKLDLLQTIKTLVLAPAVSALSAFATFLLGTGLSNLPAVSSYFTPSLVLDYGIAVGVVVFAIVIADRIDLFLIKDM